MLTGIRSFPDVLLAQWRSAAISLPAIARNKEMAKLRAEHNRRLDWRAVHAIAAVAPSW